jgi:hypothetical protein
MAERAAHLVDQVIPDVPVRQWVLSLPHRLRYRLAWDHDLRRRVTAVFLRAVFRLRRDHARAVGLEQPRGGAVAIIQRFGGALNLNVHIHALVLDGVFARDAAGAVGFHPAPRLTTLDVAEVLAAVEPRLRQLLQRGGRREDAPGGDPDDGGVDPWVDEAPALADLAAASVQGLVALGRQSGTRVRRLGHARAAVDRPLGSCHARWHGWDLHAGLVVPARQRDRLERVCRYALRPPVASERLALTADGRVRLALSQPWADGTWVRCPDLSAVWRPPAPYRAHRTGGGHWSNPRAPRSPHGSARRSSRASAAAVRRAGRRARRRVRIPP